jgi:uncharacterized protein YndB with AHSA1/START domain
MKWFIRLLIVIAILIVAMFIMGSSLPEHHQATATREFTISRDSVWAVITDFQKFPSWRSGLKEILVKDNEFTEVSSDDEAVSYRIEEFTPPERLVTRIATLDLPYGGSWTYELTPTPGGCSLTITENGEVYNPMFRFIANYMIGHASTMEKYLDDLDKRIQ